MHESWRRKASMQVGGMVNRMAWFEHEPTMHRLSPNPLT